MTMAKTNAERQADYRKKHLVLESGTKERLNMLVNGTTKAKLERITFHYGVTKTKQRSSSGFSPRKRVPYWNR